MKIRKTNPLCEGIKSGMTLFFVALCITFTVAMFSVAVYKTAIIVMKRNFVSTLVRIQHSELAQACYKKMDEMDKWWVDNIE